MNDRLRMPGRDEDAERAPIRARGEPTWTEQDADRIGRLERRMDRAEQRQGDGDVAMAELRGEVRHLTDATRQLTQCMDANTVAMRDMGQTVAKLGERVTTAQETAAKPGEWVRAIVLIILQWGLPILAIALLWSSLSSGALPMRAPATTSPGTAAP